MKGSNHWMVLYDIRDSKRLNKVEKCVASYGWRVQYSVFELDADEKTIQTMKSDLKYIVEDEDFVLILSICERDWQKRELYGKATKNNPMADNYMIL